MSNTFKMEDNNIKMVRGDTLSFGVEFRDENGKPFDGVIDGISFTCKSNKRESISIFEKTLESGISKVSEGSYTVRVAPEDTANVPAGKYYYDMQIKVNGDVFTPMKGLLELEQDITK